MNYLASDKDKSVIDYTELWSYQLIRELFSEACPGLIKAFYKMVAFKLQIIPDPAAFKNPSIACLRLDKLRPSVSEVANSIKTIFFLGKDMWVVTFQDEDTYYALYKDGECRPLVSCKTYSVPKEEEESMEAGIEESYISPE